jgi:hypothetical protein
VGNDRGGELSDAIGAAGENVDEGESGCREEGFDLLIAGLAFGPVVGGVVEFDGQQRLEGFGMADDEVDTASGTVLPGLAAFGIGKKEELAERNLREDVSARADDVAEDMEKVAFGVGDEELVDDDARRQEFGGGAMAQEIGEKAEEAADRFAGHGRDLV